MLFMSTSVMMNVGFRTTNQNEKSKQCMIDG